MFRENEVPVAEELLVIHAAGPRGRLCMTVASTLRLRSAFRACKEASG